MDGKETEVNEELPVLISSFHSKIVKLRVSKKNDMRDQELLESESSDDNSGGIWNSITTNLGLSSSEETATEETLNIFCLASGHLYERLIR